MRFILITALALFSGLVHADEFFDDRGVWHVIDNATLTAQYVQTFGVIDVSDRDNVLNMLVYGDIADDSLSITLELRGMMSPELSDSGQSIQIFTTTRRDAGEVVAYADTLDDDQFYPYLMGRLTNVSDSSLANTDLWLYMQPREFIFGGN